MSFLSLLVIRDGEGSLERLLGVTRRRGFNVRSFSAQPHFKAGRWEVALRVEGERSPGILQRHLASLHEVESVEIYRKEAHPIGVGGVS